DNAPAPSGSRARSSISARSAHNPRSTRSPAPSAPGHNPVATSSSGPASAPSGVDPKSTTARVGSPDTGSVLNELTRARRTSPTGTYSGIAATSPARPPAPTDTPHTSLPMIIVMVYAPVTPATTHR